MIIGRTARIVAAIPEDGEGEVMVDLPDHRGGTQIYPARVLDGSAQPIGRIVYVAEQTGRMLYVTTR